MVTFTFLVSVVNYIISLNLSTFFKRRINDILITSESTTMQQLLHDHDQK